MDHPAIAPNSEMFGKYNDGTYYFEYVTSGISHKIPLEEKYIHYINSNEDIITIIRSVAYTEWTIEVRRISKEINKLYETGMRAMKLEAEIMDFAKQRIEAEKTAEEWLRWKIV